MRRSYRAGATLFHEGDASDWAMLLTVGRVKIASTTTTGRDVVLALATRAERDLLQARLR